MTPVRGELVLVGASHRTAPIALRERLALSRDAAGELLAELSADPALDEVLVLSTCGRTELYALASEPDAGMWRLTAALANHAGIRTAELAALVHTERGRDVVQHIHRVAAGLDSMALGEVEILGQLRRAGELAGDAGARGRILGRLVESSLASGRRVRHETDIGLGRTAIASAVVGITSRHVGRLSGSALVIGSGDTGAKTSRALRAAGFAVTLVAGRRQERASRLAAELGCPVATLGELPRLLTEVEVVVSCTSAPHHLISAGTLADAMESRMGRELIAIDLAVPRDFDPTAREVAGVRLYDLDELEGELRATAGRRIAAAPAAEAIVAGEVDRFMHWMAALGVVPTIKDLRSHSEGAVFDALRRSDLAAGADEELLRATTEAIVTRLLHSPTLRLREAAAQGNAERLGHVVRELFALDTVAPRLT